MGYGCFVGCCGECTGQRNATLLESLQFATFYMNVAIEIVVCFASYISDLQKKVGFGDSVAGDVQRNLADVAGLKFAYQYFALCAVDFSI